MTVKEVIEEYQGKEIKIGGGTGFIWCGLVDDITPKLIDYLSNEEYKRLIDLKEGYEYHLEHFEELWEKRFENNEINKQQKKKYKSPKAMKEEKEKDKKNTLKQIDKTTRKINEFTPFDSREVKEIYLSIINPDVSIIIFEGDINGMYWDREEVEKSPRMEVILNELKQHD